MDKILKDYSRCSDEFLIAQVLTLLRRHNISKNSLKSPPKPSKAIGSHQFSFKYRQNSREFNHNTKRRNTQPNPSRNLIQLTPQSRTSSCEIEFLLYFQNVFNKIFDLHQTTELVKNEIEKMCSLVIIKQFFLDHYVADSTFFNTLVAPLKGKTWINSDDFLLSMIAVQVKGGNTVKNRIIRKNEGQWSTQQMLCKVYAVFFNVIRFMDGEEVGRDGLERMAGMMYNKSRPQVQNFVDGILLRVNDSKKGHVVKLSCNDFFKIIVKD